MRLMHSDDPTEIPPGLEGTKVMISAVNDADICAGRDLPSRKEEDVGEMGYQGDDGRHRGMRLILSDPAANERHRRNRARPKS